MYGGSAPKGQNTDPRSGRVRGEEILRSRGGIGSRRLAVFLLGAVVAVVLAVVLFIVL